MSNSDKLRDLALSEKVLDSDKDTKILGMRWDAESDTISFAETKQLKMDTQLTKRELLRQSSAIYDPLGLLGPITIRAKTLIQELWKKGYAWDETLPKKIENEWTDVKNDILQITTKLKIQRYYFANHDEETSDTTLHIFVDASQKAYGASVYLSKGTESTLVIAKNRVAPLKLITLPKLELMAAVIGARLSKDVIENLGVKRAVFWSDSQIVLHWLTSSKSLNKFVKNRVSEIKELSETHEWKYVPTEMNPADLQTRGLTASQFEDSTLWMNGPQWLTDECKWPTWTGHVEISTQLSNITGPKTHRSDDKVPSDPQQISQIIDMNRYSDLNRLLTVTGYVLKFVKNCQKKRPYRLRSSQGDRNLRTSLTEEEISLAMNLWIKDTQQDRFVKELEHISLNPKVKSLPLVQQLRLYLDENGIIRCKGRIQNSSIEENAKFPILLPKNHKLTDFVIMDAHLRNLHTGVGQTITHIRQSYWIPAIRQCVNSVLRKCIQCQKIIGKPYNSPEPPPLPKDRVKDTIPFCTTGIDFAGPLHIKDTSTQPRKVYICLFTCACIRAIHLELVPDLSLNTFILAFRRFISRKGIPQTIYSDNAPTFVAASNALQSQLNLHINWKFIPKGAPWYGGWWERLIGLTKMTLKKVFGKALVSEQSLTTILTEIETIINNRPLTYISSDIRDPEPLTPSHLLHGRIITTTEMHNDKHNANIQELDTITANKLFERKGLLLDHFAKRWSNEYLTGLREYHRASGKHTGQVNIGDVVQLGSESPRLLWRLGTIEDIIKGGDGLIRAAKVRTSRGLVTTRPIVKLYPLEL
ncbi:uncharacterized protein [Mytilus edulis]|uniref:uncharacterized protein n=1 Tax=Mytilus edulis TaxID=6550 RepID=UPI0039EF1331